MFHKTFEAGILNIDGNDVWKGFQGNNPPRSWAFRSHSKVIKKVMTTLKLEDINVLVILTTKYFQSFIVLISDVIMKCYVRV